MTTNFFHPETHCPYYGKGPLCNEDCQNDLKPPSHVFVDREHLIAVLDIVAQIHPTSANANALWVSGDHAISKLRPAVEHLADEANFDLSGTAYGETNCP